MAKIPFWAPCGPRRAQFWQAPALGPVGGRGSQFVNWPYLGLDVELHCQPYHFYQVFGGSDPPLSRSEAAIKHLEPILGWSGDFLAPEAPKTHQSRENFVGRKKSKIQKLRVLKIFVMNVFVMI